MNQEIIMCDTCGCNQPEQTITIAKPGTGSHYHYHPHHDLADHEHDHSHKVHPHEHEQGHDHAYSHAESRTIAVEQDVMAKNNLLAERNRGYFEAKRIFTLNLLSSPGSGKTTLLERTIRDLKKQVAFSVIEGDQQTLRDAERIQAVGAPVIQVNTGNGCHLDADMINRALKQLLPENDSILLIENVGNLVCPALFDLGEAKKVVVISVTEGDDKPLKYPTMFSAAHLCLINKMDLLPYVDFKVERLKEYALKVNHHLSFFELSAKTGVGLENWFHWLTDQVKA
jgi:hydrogenase nickel incorporation protein HypB